MSHPAFSRFRLISITFFVFGIVSVAVAFNATTAQEVKQRVIARMPVEKDEPLAITDVKVNGQNVTFGQKFSADDEWLGSLVFTVKNTSDKRMLFASIRLQFPRPAGSQETISVHDIYWGNSGLQTQLPKPDERLAEIKPGETADITLTTQQFAELKNFLSLTHYAHSIDRVSLSIGHIIFDDDTMWYAGAIARRDPKDPTTWINSQYSTSRPQ